MTDRFLKILDERKDGESTTLRFVVDFEKEELRAYDEDGNVIAEGDLYLPAATNATTGLEYMQCMTSNIMRLNGASNKDEEATLCVHYINVSERDIFAN